MARFLGATQGSRGEATRLGTAASGIRAQAQGWDVGVKVYGRDDDGRDSFQVCATRGSHDMSSLGEIATVTRNDAGEIVAHFPAWIVEAIWRNSPNDHIGNGVTITL